MSDYRKKFKMTAIIADPKTNEGMISDLLIKMTCYFGEHASPQYGNGSALVLDMGESGMHFIDLRYDKDFHRGEETEYLTEWANNYWSGQDGAYKVKQLTIEQLPN